LASLLAPVCFTIYCLLICGACIAPLQLVEVILRQCSPSQLGMLESTCSYFHRNKLIEKIAKQKLKQVPRARGLKPNKK
jgi:hypothetical protein